MAYVPLRYPKDLPPRVRSAVLLGAEPFLREAHWMLGVRVPGDPGRQLQFSIAMTLLATISGISATLYSRAGPPGDLFVGLLKDHYPWEVDPPDGISAEGAAHILYDEFRNPFAHSLGLRLYPSKRIKVGLVFGALDADIEQLAVAERPAHSSIERTDDKITLWADSLYWGVRCMLERMVADQDLMARAEAHLKEGKFARR